jgi:hypothetical protein
MPDEDKNLAEKNIAEKSFQEIPEEEENIEPKKNLLRRALVILLVVAIAAALYYLLLYKKPDKNAGKTEPTPANVLAKQIVPEGSGEGASTPPVELDKSDDFVRQWAKELSSHPRLSLWLKSGQLVRRFVAAVDNIANGLSPGTHIDFFVPPGEFVAAKKGTYYVVDPQEFERYNSVVDVFVSLDSKQCVALFHSLKPLCQEAYRDLGYPDQDFEATLVRALAELLETPVVEGDILLEKAVVNYVMLDPDLETLSDAQKHLLRMGPVNTEAIQTKLREMAQILGVQDNQLPKARRLVPKSGNN